MTGRTPDRIVGAALIVGVLLAIWGYATFSPYQQCIREKVNSMTDVPNKDGLRRERAENVCLSSIDPLSAKL